MTQFPRPDIQEFFRTYTISMFAVSKGEERIAYATNLSGKFNLWGLDLPNTYPYPLTYQDQSPHAAAFDPQGRYILVSFDTDGDENTQLYQISPSGGALKPVCTFPGRRHYFAQLSKDGNRVYYCSDKENHNFLNGYVYDMERDEERVLYTGEGGACYLVEVAEDESSFVYVKHFANTYMPAFLVSGESVRSLTPDPSVVHVVNSVTYAKDKVYFTTDYEANRTYLASYDLESGAFEKVLILDDADIDGVTYHADSATLYFVAATGVEDRLYSYHVPSGTAEQIDLPVTVVTQMKVGDSGRIYVLGTSDTEPYNLHVYNTADAAWTRLTNNRVMGVAQEELVTAQTVCFPSYDGLEIEALWFEANPARANGYTIVWPHGGPQAAERRSYRSLFQFLCSRGYNVFAPNFRGSSGYGSKFVKMVEGDWGEGPRLDMVESIEWILREGKAERDKLFLMGGSYGGYMSLLLHGRHGEYFQAVVDIFGPSNLFTFLESVPDSWKPAMKQWLGDPDEDRERLTKDSPITYLDEMKKPMLVIQGANDPRVVKAESDQIVEALKERGVHVEYIVFDDEGHGFSKKENEMKAFGRAADFLDAYRN